MCGIIGINAKEAFTSQTVLSKLKKLEYRGYDSWGYWNGKTLRKETGKILVVDDNEETTRAISHTRWATHGGVTRENAHPHRAGKVTIVHNGIIENWKKLKKELTATGATFQSATDSEVIAHYVNQKLASGEKMPRIMQELVNDLQGTFATLIMVDDDPNIYAAKRDSPLALGLCKEKNVLASDIYAFSDETDQAIFFDNNEWAVITGRTHAFYNAQGAPVTKEQKTFTWQQQRESKEEYDYFMRKEIGEQPTMSERLLASLAGEQAATRDELVAKMKKAKRVVFTAAGTAYHASLLGASILHQCGLQAQAIIASEFENFITVDPDTLVIAVSQSGETMDVIEALKYSKGKGATIASIVNVPYSSIERMSTTTLHILAGQEVAVASTKAFTNQALTLLHLAKAFGYDDDLENTPKALAATLQHEADIVKLSQQLAPKNDLYIIGRKLGYPIAREMALKIKEVSYVHAEGMMGGELKHGTIALIEEETPVISLVYDDDPKMRGSTQEVRARGAHVTVIGTNEEDEFCVAATSEASFALHAAVIGQLLAYHLAKQRGCPIDKPRNLAKSVTVL